MKRLIALTALGLLLATMTACASSGPGTDISCHIFAPIRFSLADTPETIRALIEYNEVLESLCSRSG